MKQIWGKYTFPVVYNKAKRGNEGRNKRGQHRKNELLQ